LVVIVVACLMAIGVFLALLYVAHKFDASDAQILVAVYFIVLQFFIICALALLFSSFSSPLLSAVFTFSLFIIGSFSEDLRGFATMSHGLTRWLASGAGQRAGRKDARGGEQAAASPSENQD
jgi:hypothetical protein